MINPLALDRSKAHRKLAGGMISGSKCELNLCLLSQGQSASHSAWGFAGVPRRACPRPYRLGLLPSGSTMDAATTRERGWSSGVPTPPIRGKKPAPMAPVHRSAYLTQARPWGRGYCECRVLNSPDGEA